jgi:hypothetical protein
MKKNLSAKRRREAPHQGLKNKLFFLMMGAAVSAAAPAQVPDASIKLDVYANYLSEQPGRTTIRLFDALGHVSTVGLRLRTDLGFQAYASQKLQIIPHGGDPDHLDEYYVESPGNWVVGKQYLPFGQGSLLHESALAVRSDLFITTLELPITVAACDAGPGRQLGVVARVGDHFGASAAIGEHFGIAGSSLALIRQPTQAADVGHGYHAIYGLDFDSRQDEWEFRAEAMALRAPETPTDLTDIVADATVHYDPSSQRGFEIGITHSARERADFVRFQAFIKPIAKVSIEPMIRFRNFELFDVSVSLHVKL